MKNEIKPSDSATQTKLSGLFIIFQTASAVLLLMFALLGIIAGIKFLIFLDHTETHRNAISNKWSETGFEQLQQMNATIKQELDLIIDQRRETQALQMKVQQLTAQAEVETQTQAKTQAEVQAQTQMKAQNQSQFETQVSRPQSQGQLQTLSRVQPQSQAKNQEQDQTQTLNQTQPLIQIQTQSQPRALTQNQNQLQTHAESSHNTSEVQARG